MLWRMHHPETIWYWIAGVGVVSLVAMVAYTYAIGAIDRRGAGEQGENGGGPGEQAGAA
jgi:hypothetical protein